MGVRDDWAREVTTLWQWQYMEDWNVGPPLWRAVNILEHTRVVVVARRFIDDARAVTKAPCCLLQLTSMWCVQGCGLEATDKSGH